MPRRSKALLDRAERANQSALPMVVLLSGDPQVHQLLGRSLGEREAMIGTELFAANDGESVKQFHRRLCQIARERRIASGVTSGLAIVSVPDDTPQKELLFNLDGSPITVN